MRLIGRYAALIISCPAGGHGESGGSGESGGRAPYAVTVLADACDRTTPNLLRVQRPPASSHRSRVNYTVCVTPLNFRYNNYQQLVETIEVCSTIFVRAGFSWWEAWAQPGA